MSSSVILILASMGSASRPISAIPLNDVGRKRRTVLTLRSMGLADLDLVESWLHDPEVARWFLVGSTIEAEVEELRQCVTGDKPTEALVVVEHNEPIGWCQWYLCREYPEHEKEVGARLDDIGIDYAIGDPSRRSRGVGTTLIAELVTYVRRGQPRSGIIADPEAANAASRKVLEKNGFELLGVRPVASEPTDAPMAIYRLRPESGSHL